VGYSDTMMNTQMIAPDVPYIPSTTDEVPNYVNFNNNEYMNSMYPYNNGVIVNPEISYDQYLNMMNNGMVNMEAYNVPMNATMTMYPSTYPTVPVDTQLTTTTSSYIESFEDIERKRPRKRKRKAAVNLPTAEQLSNIQSYEDGLLSLDSVSFDEYVDRALQFHRFSDDDRNLLRDIRRRIKNRESARKSRKNKRTKMSTLEGQVMELTDETVGLKREIFNLKVENNQLRSEVVYLQNVINSSHASHEMNNMKQVKEEPPLSSNPLPGSAINTQSILLFVILFSFGLLWNLDTNVIFNSSSSFFHGRKQFINEVVRHHAEDPMLDQLLNRIQDDGRCAEEAHKANKDHGEQEKDVEICCF